MHTLERSQILPAARDEIFAFFEDPNNLEKMTPSRMGFRILKTDELPMRPGFRIKYRIKVFGAPVRWLTTITEYEPGRRFVDEQTTGPYAFWRHEHLFEDTADGTLMRDHVQYRLPFGILGNAVQKLIVARELERIFDYRARRMEELFAGPADPA